ncbi:MAG: HAD family hydrolase [Pseudomonadales bacterium]
MTSYDALIFDCDGVLVNSEEIVQDIELALLAESGLHYDRSAFAQRFLGVSDEYFYRALNRDANSRLGKPLPQDFPEVLHRRARAAFQERLQAFPGTAAVLRRCTSKIAVASSSSIAGLSFKLAHTELKAHFEPHIYSAEHVAAGKPEPDIYHYAAAQIDSQPAACLVVEDSINGVLAGVAAGMTVLGFTAGAHCGAGHEAQLLAAGARKVVSSMAELQTELQRLGMAVSDT